MNALAGLISPAAIAQGTQQAFRDGRKAAQDRELDRAMADYAKNPDDADAVRRITRYNPELGQKLLERQRSQQFNNAAADYYTGEGGHGPTPAPRQAPASGLNALAMGAPAAMPQQQRNALMPPAAPGTSFDQAFAPMAGGGIVATPEQQAQSDALARRFGMEGVTVDDRAPQAEPDFSVLGAPASHKDESFLRMLKIDAKAAFAIDGEMRDRAADRLKLQRDAYGMAVARLGAVNDEQGYQAALADIAQTIEPLGVEVTDHLPAQFPGPDGLKQLRLGALDAKDQLTQFMNEANIDADNARADRNTDSLIANRDERLAEQRRATNERIATTRRGQDLSDARGRRGQDLTNSRAASRGSPREKLPTISTPEQARKLPSGTKFRTPTGQVKIVP